MKNIGPKSLDELDIRLMQQLELNGRQTVTKLAEKLGTSQITVRKKLNGLLTPYLTSKT